MTSRLSSLLVRDGVIGVRRMEKAFQRQVLFGGSLDTILLEMNELTEQRLLQYLSLATGLPPATSRELERVEPAAAEACDRDRAERFAVVPLAFEADALRVLTQDPVDLAALEELANELAMPVQPFIAPEFRFALTFDRVFGRQSDSRFLRLAEAARLSAPSAPVGRSPSVVIEAEPAPSDAPVEPVQPVEPEAARAGLPPETVPVMRQTLEMTGDAARRHREEVEGRAASEFRRLRSDTLPDPAIPGVPEPPDVPEEIDDDQTPPEVVIEYGVPETSVPHDTQRVPYAMDDARSPEVVSGYFASADASAPPVVAVPPAPSGRVDSAGVPSIRRMADFDRSPLSAAEARELLARAEHRDLVFQILLRAVRARAYYAALLTVQGAAAIGRVAIAGDELDQTQITQVLIPLDTPSSFRQVTHTSSPYIGPLATGDAEIDGMIRRLGGVVPPSAMILPLVLRNRVVALLVGHRGADTLQVTEVSELLPLAGAASEALSRIIVRGKAQAARPTSGEPEAVPEPFGEPATGRVADPAGRGSRPMATIVEGAEAGVGGHAPAALPARIAEMMAAMEGGEGDVAEAALRKAAAHPADVLPWLREHFPGPLTVDRFELGGRHLRAAQHGRILDLVVRLGPAASELLVEKLRDSHRDVRYYATLCASEVRPDAALTPLVERLFDADYGVREVATEGLSGYPARPLDDALELPRRALHGEDLERLGAAATALAALADVRAIPELLDVHGRGGEAAIVVGQALVQLTKQDFGVNNRKWRLWWDKSRRRHRIEWLLEGLGHKEPAIRRSAAEDLRKATGEYFGYHHDLPRREREQARQRWLDWWNQTGRLRFLPEPEHERHRPTGLLPPTRRP